MKISNWNIEEMTGYVPQTTFWMDFSIADAFGKNAILDTYNTALEEWKNNYVYITELVMVLNWKSWQYQNNEEFCKLYAELYYRLDAWCWDHFNEEEKEYYYRVTD